jgi:hypothetical protein
MNHYKLGDPALGEENGRDPAPPVNPYTGAESDFYIYLFGKLFCAGSFFSPDCMRPRMSRSHTASNLNGRTLPYDARGGHGWFRSQ